MSRGLRFVGITSTVGYVGYMREAETNGCAERFVKTLKVGNLLEKLDALEAGLIELEKRYKSPSILDLSPVEDRKSGFLDKLLSLFKG